MPAHRTPATCDGPSGCRGLAPCPGFGAGSPDCKPTALGSIAKAATLKTKKAPSRKAWGSCRLRAARMEVSELHHAVGSDMVADESPVFAHDHDRNLVEANRQVGLFELGEVRKRVIWLANLRHDVD